MQIGKATRYSRAIGFPVTEGRKVRTAQGNAPPNGWVLRESGVTDSATENNRPGIRGKGENVG
ncbi:hypothetical protein CCY01nite_45930 [Chitinophaga cymbidii]|uniref:Uncharacterized protein n=1 Tax=Chitinophaga cymbidii TaxID=1096750 RepID=A0A512RRK7_9BACT|nr:hypothetical protein CCY01nite_45930 [Chitinophaga cymbidii]